jgi:16S rRNA (guanine966-N2)-methyltransferase
MRIIAGQRRGHKIDGPRASARTRPTSELVRESIFNILGELVVDSVVVDLFAGTGALGLEALSRGASRAIFVESDRGNVGLIFRNIATLRYEDRTQVRHADAYRWVRSFEPVGERPLVVLIDPPYREGAAHERRLNQLITHLVEKLPPASAVALEVGAELDASILPDFESWDVRRYGDTRIAIHVVPRPSELAVPSNSEGDRHSAAAELLASAEGDRDG